MAKYSQTNKKVLASNDRTAYYQDLAYMPSGYKEKRIWMAQSIYYAKKNSTLLVPPEVAAGYRAADKLIIDQIEYRQIIDPPNPKDAGGKAEFMAADFKAYPIDMHLDNVVRAKLEKIPNNLSVKINDPVAKLLEQKDKEKIIYNRAVRNLINTVNEELGLPKIPTSQDPYKWVESFSQNGGKAKKQIDSIGTVVDQLKNKIENDDQLRMFMKYVYKNGLEIAFEAAIKYYFIDLNNWNLLQDDFIVDLKQFNIFTGMWYTDQMTGRPVVKHLDPSSVYTSPFVQKNGNDLLYWGSEFYVNFSEFERMLGATLDDEQKKKILDVNKLWSNAYGTDVSVQWRENLRINAQIKLGTFSVLTQEAEEFAQYYIDNTGTLSRTTATWDDESEINQNNECKAYNVWYRCYYVPMPDTETAQRIIVGTEGWVWLSNYVFAIEKEIDMYRYGVDSRYAKSALVIYRDKSRPSYSQIKERFMPKIHTLWHKIQNCIVQDVNAMAWDYDLMGAMLGAIDDANEKDPNGGNALIQEMKSLKQSGLSWVKFRDKNGNLLVADPSKLFVMIKSGHMETAEKYWLNILQLYNEMTKALGISTAAQGVQPDPRTPASGIEIANEASDNSRWYLEKAMIECARMYGERVVQYVNKISKEKDDYHYEKRWKEFVDVVGFANGASIESIDQINIENIGITVKNENNEQQKQLVLQIATQKTMNNQIPTAEWGLILDTDNWKYQLMEISLAEEKVQKDLQIQKQLEFQQQMQLQQAQLQTALALQGAKAQGVNQNIQTQGVVDAQVQGQMNQLKEQTMAQQKQQLLQNKLTENLQKSNLKKQENNADAFAEAE